MRSYNLNIANYVISFKSEPDGLDLVSGERFRSFLSNNDNFDILITVHSGIYMLPSEAVKVFDAPYVEEINGIRIKKSYKFWSIHKSNDVLFMETTFPLSSEKKSAILKFSFSAKEWDLWFDGAGKEADPLEYPLDGLILYYLTAINSDIMIHASGVNHEGHGYLFSGVSGKGKTTMAKLWDNAGAQVIHDDRLIIRNTGDGYKMFNTPVYNNDEPKESMLDRIFLIEHGKKNDIIPVSGAAAVSMVMANCIQHNWNQEMVSRLIDSVTTLCNAVPVVRLPFLPDRNIIDMIPGNE